MEKLWAPWRSKYIYLRKREGCIFCVRFGKSTAKERYIIARGRNSFAMLNIYPYNNGHVMVAPLRHVKGLKDLSDDEIADLFRVAKRVMAILDRKLKPHGYNLGMNIGRVAGAGFENHLHLHIVPRWRGDTNFMPVVADTKIVSESLDTLHKIFKGA
jgi:ATP adenylyltransferase